MIRPAAALVVLCLTAVQSPAVQAGVARGGRPPNLTPISVRYAVGLCRSNPSQQYLVSVRGYFSLARAALGNGYHDVQGGIFPTAHVPNGPGGTILRWSIEGRWKRFDALFLIVGKVIPHHSGILQTGWITAHGRLACWSLTLFADRNPFPAGIPLPSGGGGVVNRWNVRRVLGVQIVADLCASHQASRFNASVRGYLTASPLQGPGGGFVGRLFTAPNPHAFFAGDTKPFVQVWGNKAWSLSLTGRQVTFHGILACDAATYSVNLPGWRGSITPDRYSVKGAG